MYQRPQNTINMDNVEDTQSLHDSVEELKAKLEAMKLLIEKEELETTSTRKRKKTAASIIDGTFLSVVFCIVFVLIVSVGFYAYYNLFVAVMKKYRGPHSEL